jgi:hypothetical protein
VHPPTADRRPTARPPRRGRLLPLAALGASGAGVLCYLLVRQLTSTDTAALAIVAAASAAATLLAGLRRRPLLWIGVVVTVGFALALLATALSGGSSLPLKLYRPVTTGLVGLALLAGAAARRPLLPWLLDRTARANPQRAAGLRRLAADPAGRRRLLVVSALLGTGLLAEAGVTVALALSTSTVTFLAASRIAKWAIAGVTLAVVLVYLRVARRPARDPGADQAGRAAPLAQPERTSEPVPARKAWFGPKRVGFGFRPQTWQGWAILIVVIAVIAFARRILL